MPKLLVRPSARRDLSDIWRFTARRWSRKQADRYLTALHQTMTGLRDRELTGRPCDEISAGLLRKTCNRHVIFFRLEPDVMVVVRILHQSVDHAAHLPDEP
jgi:toxin ParE1/3/4